MNHISLLVTCSGRKDSKLNRATAHMEHLPPSCCDMGSVLCSHCYSEFFSDMQPNVN